MKEKFAQFLKRNLFPWLIVLLTIYLSLVNYEPGTWLSGWDTLHPEFNFSLNFERLLDGVWREKQGLGAVAGHSHMADLPRVVILFLLSFIFSLDSLRYSFIFLTLIAGPLGVFYFLEKIVLKNQSPLQNKIASFLGSLFYLLNLGTLQHFYVPFEMFNVQYAALGWLFLFATRFLENQKKKSFLLFSTVTFLAAPQAYAATLWYAYFSALILYLGVFSFPTLIKRDFNVSKRAIVLLVVTLIVNSFWLLPNVYFILNHASSVPQVKINRLFSEEAYLHTQEYGNIKDTAILKNFLFNWAEYDGQGSSKYLLDEWIKHLENPIVLTIGYFSFALVILGLILSLRKRKEFSLPLASIFLFSLIFLINSTPGINQLFNFLRSQLVVFKEALRFPFTKFSILLMFCYAVYFSLGISYLFDLLKKIIKKKIIVAGLLIILITTGLVFYMLPAFQGNLISPSMKIKIPDEYFQIFDWFNQQEAGRVAKLPVHTFWGWVYHDWGFQGAGFLWFGIKQPLLDREFDRWSPYNEHYYQEISYAIYSQNLSLLENILDKYQIRWILLDESVISPGNEKKVLFYEETNKLLSSSPRINLVRKFGEKLKVFRFDLDKEFPTDQFIQVAETENVPDDSKQEILAQIPTRLSSSILSELLPKQIIPFKTSKFQFAPELCDNQDVNQVFGVSAETNGFQLFAKNSVACVRFPLSSIFNKILNKKILFEVKFDFQPKTDEKPLICLYDNRLGRCVGQRFPDYYFEIEDNLDNYQLQFLLDAVGSDEEKRIFYKNINLILYEQVESSSIPELTQEAGFFDITLINRQPEVCSAPEPQRFDRKIIEENDSRYIEYLSENGSVCDYFTYPQLSHNQGYALVVESRNLEGLPLRLCLTNYETRRCDIYTELPRTSSFSKSVFLIPPMEQEGQGYDINLNNYSIGKTSSINHLKSIQIFPIKYDWIQLRENPAEPENLIVLNQSFEKNWLAFEFKKPFLIQPLKSHVLVNGWANGWLLDSQLITQNSQIYFFFLPQLLEYFGFLLLFILIVFLHSAVWMV